MITDVAGRVKNVNLPASRPLLPLLEAISNSIDAIQDAGVQDGYITIDIIREENSLFGQSEKASERQLGEIIGFEIRDNGIGFDEVNFAEFGKADTTYKASRGGKGVGRFSWLAAFETAEIESVFSLEGNTKLRKFRFCMKDTGINDHTISDSPGAKRETIVRLNNFREKYRTNCPRTLAVIAAFIVEEFLNIFIGHACPVITLREKSSSEKIQLDLFYEKEMMANAEVEELKLKNSSFSILHVRLYSKHIPEHRLYFCARGQVVIKEKMSGIPNLIRRFEDAQGREFVYAAYVNSSLLDEVANADRTGFVLSEDINEINIEEITMGDIRKAIRAHCQEYLAPYTKVVSERKRARVQNFIEKDGAMYRPIMRHLESALDTIAPDATDAELDMALYEGYHKLQTCLRMERNDLLKAITEDEEFENFRKRMNSFFEIITEINRSDLARYVCHRKEIIEFLKMQLGIKSSGKYRTEDRIHNIIFPVGKTSDQICFEDHNLWLIDERLAFHVFLSSDRPIKQAKLLANESGEEPDIMVFDKAVAFSETADVPFTSITIIEFKRPQRNEYSETENPFTQIAKYIDHIRDGRAKHADGRSLPVPPTLPFYCYIICDMTPKLKDWARYFELSETPDALGFFGYKKNFNAYCEVISYSKLVSDAEKRSKAFFVKLGLS